MGTAYIHHAVFNSSMDTTTPGTSGTSIKKLKVLCASLNDLAFIATATCRAAANRASGTDTRQTMARSAVLTRQLMPTSSSGSQDRMAWAMNRPTPTPIMDSTAAASHLPITSY